MFYVLGENIMSLFKRFWNMLKSNLNSLIGKAEDPEKMLEQMLLDMQENLINAKRQVAIAIADEKKLKKQCEDESLLEPLYDKSKRHIPGRSVVAPALKSIENKKLDMATTIKLLALIYKFPKKHLFICFYFPIY